MVSADNEKIGSVVSTDDGMPESFAWPGHAHRQRQERKQSAILLVIQLGKSLVGADARVVLYITRLRHPDGRMQQERTSNSVRGLLGHFFVGPVERVARLKGHNISLSDTLEFISHLRRSHS